jgi:hypothetical protein
VRFQGGIIENVLIDMNNDFFSIVFVYSQPIFLMAIHRVSK